MANRADLQTFLEELMGNENVYFDPPESKKLEYPAIVYSLDEIVSQHANDNIYMQNLGYQAILIDRNADSEYVDVLTKVKYCRFVRHYTSNGLHHWVFNLYHE